MINKLILIAVFLLLGCKTSDNPTTLTIAPQKVDCQGVGVQQCLWVKYEG